MKRAVLACVTAVLLLASVSTARTWSIAPGGGGDAPTIQAGIDSSAAGDTVLAGPGAYSENLTMKDGVVLASSAGLDSTSIQPALENVPVVVCDSLGTGTVIQGFTFQGIRSTESGAVILNRGASVEVTANRFANNYSDADGGCIAQSGGAGRISGNVFEADTAAEWGGAIYCVDSATPTIEGNLIASCRATCGGAISCSNGASPWIGYNTIRENESDWGGGIFCRYDAAPIIKANLIEWNACNYGGGGIKCWDAERAWIRDNIIQFNSALRGGGLQTTDVTFPNFWLNVFRANTADLEGGGVRVSGCVTAKCVSNTFYGNTAGEHGPSLSVGTGPLEELVVRQSIFSYSPGPPAVDGGVLDIDCSDFWGNDADFPPTAAVGADVFYLDPMFCDADSGDFQIDYDSPCADYADCGLVGALGVGCDLSGVHTTETPPQPAGLQIGLSNPCYQTTRLTFSLPKPGHALLTVYDAVGRRIAVLADTKYEMDVIDVTWEGTDSSGRQVPPGIYFCRLEAGGRTVSRKIVLLR